MQLCCGTYGPLNSSIINTQHKFSILVSHMGNENHHLNKVPSKRTNTPSFSNNYQKSRHLGYNRYRHAIIFIKTLIWQGCQSYSKLVKRDPLFLDVIVPTT